MSRPQNLSQAAVRAARHRRKLRAGGAKRIEVTVPAGDADLVKGLAALLRAGGETARPVHERVQPLFQPKAAASGKELVAFFRSSPLVGEELEFERDRSSGRPVDL